MSPKELRKPHKVKSRSKSASSKSRSLTSRRSRSAEEKAEEGEFEDFLAPEEDEDQMMRVREEFERLGKERKAEQKAQRAAEQAAVNTGAVRAQNIVNRGFKWRPERF
jgi:hypothetical protein